MGIVSGGICRHVPEKTHWDPAYSKVEVEYLMAAQFDAAGKLTNAQDPAIVALANQPIAIDGDAIFEIMEDHADAGEFATPHVTPVNIVPIGEPEIPNRPKTGVGLCLSGCPQA